MTTVRGFVKRVTLGMSKEQNPVVLLVVQVQDIEGATELFKDEEVTVQSAQGKLALAKE